MLFNRKIFLTVCFSFILTACSGGGGGGGGGDTSAAPVTAPPADTTPPPTTPVTSVDGIQVKNSVDKSAVLAGDSALIVPCVGTCAASVGGTTYSSLLSVRAHISLKSASTYSASVGNSAFVIPILKDSNGISRALVFNSGQYSPSGLPIKLPNNTTIEEIDTAFLLRDKDQKDISALNLYTADFSQINATTSNSTFIAAACAVSVKMPKVAKILATFAAKNSVIAATVAGNPGTIMQVVVAAGDDAVAVKAIEVEVKKKAKPDSIAAFLDAVTGSKNVDIKKIADDLSSAPDVVSLPPSVTVPWQCPDFNTIKKLDWTAEKPDGVTYGGYKDAKGHVWRLNYSSSSVKQQLQDASAWSGVNAKTDSLSAYMECFQVQDQKRFSLESDYSTQASSPLGSCALDKNDTSQFFTLTVGGPSPATSAEISTAQLVCQEPTQLEKDSAKVMVNLLGISITCPDIQ